MTSHLSVIRAPTKFLFLAVLCQGPRFSCGFASPTADGAGTVRSPVPQQQRCSDAAFHTSTIGDRRSFVTNSAAGFAASAAALLSFPLPASAKDKGEPVTTENVREAFAAIRFELEDSDGRVAKLEELVRREKYEDILAFTQETDAYFRKAKMGRARKLLTDKSLKNEAVLMCNAVTFDLIGVNRSSRPGREDTDGALKYVAELKDDIKKFLTLEGTIVIPES